MNLQKNLRGHVSLAAMGIVLILIISTASRDNPYAYSQLAAVEPTAAEQIWQIGNQPVGYLQTGGGQTQTQGQMWDLNSSYQNIEFQNSVSLQNNLQNNQTDIWSQLNSEVQSSEAQVANNPMQQSTFSPESSNLNFLQQEYGYTPDPNFGAENSSWFSSMGNTVTGWLNGAHDYFFGAPDMNACPEGVCDALGIRG